MPQQQALVQSAARLSAGISDRATAAARWARPGRAVLAAVILLMLASVSSLTLAAVAAAAPKPTPSPTALLAPPIDPDNPLAPAPVLTPPKNGTTLEEIGQEAEKNAAAERKAKEKKAREDWDKEVDNYLKAQASQGGVLSAFEVTDRNNIPVSAYRVYADTGDWNDWDLKVEHFLVEMMFLCNKWGVSFACFLLTWALSFSLAGLLLKPALTVSTSLYGGVIMQLGLPALFLTFSAVVASWHLLFGNRARGWGEMAAAMVISALAVGALASPPQMLLSKDHGAVATVRDLAVETAALILDKEAIDTGSTATTTAGTWEKAGQGATVGQRVRDSAGSIARPITDALVDAFVARPAMMLSYGRTFEDPKNGRGPKCGTLFRQSRISQAVFDQKIDEILAADNKYVQDVPFIGGPLSDLVDASTQPAETVVREKLAAKGPLKEFEAACVKDGAASAKKASMEKVGGAFFMVIAALLTCCFMIALTFSFLFAQLQIALEAMIAKVALAFGVLPGPGRGWLWDRATAIARALALLIVSITAIAVFVVVVNAVLNASDTDIPGGITIRFVVLDCVVLGAFVYRKRLTRATRGLTMRARARVGNSVAGGAVSPSELGGPKGSGMGRKLVMGGLMIGALAATGGTSATVGIGRVGTGRVAARLGGRALSGAGRAVAGTANRAGRTALAGAKGAVKTTAFGLKATVGLPVYGPRAARRVGAAAAALPNRVASMAGSAVQGMQETVQAVHQNVVAPVADFSGEYSHNLRSLGRIVTGRGGLGRYSAPRRPGHYPPAPPARRPRPAPRPRTPALAVTPAPVPAAPAVPIVPIVPAVGRRPAPPRVVQPPAGPAQAMLRQRLHRLQAQQPGPVSPQQQSPPPAAPPNAQTPAPPVPQTPPPPVPPQAPPPAAPPTPPRAAPRPARKTPPVRPTPRRPGRP
ncbi:hypothetical protein [Streptomyces sp. NBC_00233]|uniref:hypothetical protein n=1 Tax=Streptomyces sp. NBC_00233 TaxID=2975686 RepID=UPI00225423D8|nr:hypothetical protein [Streptomyces sp. NBC_00233]MCX5231465.1 stathmin family protein [Streptomyces sp. NBC_00233]MCX5233139.1 stathmin family protein [Streptomyces sp. NBC_00233]MCX5233581.1 stathmin family protein [Streptomyces sp. NBC_00233]